MYVYEVFILIQFRNPPGFAGGYFVNTVGLDEDMIKRYVKYLENLFILLVKV